MALRIGGLPVLIGPSDVIAGVRAVMGWTDDAVELVGSLPERASTLLRELELLLERVNRLADQAETMLARADDIVDSVDEVLAAAHTSVVGVEAVLAKADAVTARAANVVTQASTVTDSADGVIGKATAVTDSARAVITSASGAADKAAALLATYEPIAERAAPLARRFVEEFSEDELHAAIRLVDTLPKLTEHVESDVLPMLATLDHVGPDIAELLGVVKDLRRVLESIPGYRLFRRRGENSTEA